MPTVRAVIVWFWNTTSLALHFVDVILIFGVINVSDAFVPGACTCGQELRGTCSAAC